MRYTGTISFISLLFIFACTAHTDGQSQSEASYTKQLQQIQAKQKEYKIAWLNVSKQDSLINSAAIYLHRVIREDLFSWWKGTPWAFYGNTQIPGQGKIACGYFVTALLHDAGIELNRTKLAQDYSENMINTLIRKKHVTKSVPFSLTKFITDIKKKGDALYLIGLDCHTGFISVYQNEVWFIHSRYTFPAMVVKEKASESLILQKNHYTVTGCITCDKELIQKWINKPE